MTMHHSIPFYFSRRLHQVFSQVLLACLLVFMAQASFASSPATGQHPAHAAKAGHGGKHLTAVHPDVHINKASAGEISEALIGIGPAKAEAIVAWRKQHGAFKKLSDLEKVKGIGPATLKKNQAHIKFD
jgi:competence ComEA-like helix-hairpin-helix protein